MGAGRAGDAWNRSIFVRQRLIMDTLAGSGRLFHKGAVASFIPTNLLRSLGLLAIAVSTTRSDVVFILYYCTQFCPSRFSVDAYILARFP